ncbi:MAG: hypothetical protein BWY31_02387 [Lentisphaerae bacterium ADurb.Bin242]|nr:MAG: hypothetical protein BWY31_02387 [Lentisphaerae bacterium ADurb.Bin242]
MQLKKMNAALQWLREKYAVKANGELVKSASGSIGARAELKTADGKTVKLLPWRKERRFVELKNLVDNRTLEGVSTLRFAYMAAGKSLGELLYRELDLCTFLGESEIRSAFAVRNGKAANVVVKLFDGKNCSVECSGALPEGAETLDRHELIARRGVACDRTVDTQVPQSSIYVFGKDGETRYTDIDTELFGFDNEEILLIRAAYAVLSDPALGRVWNKADAKLVKQTADVLATEKNGKPVVYKEEKGS